MTGLAEHLAGGCTTLCQAWAVRRADGVTLGFTDHDCDLAFDGIRFSAGSGLTAKALETVSGLAVDNSEAVGALTDAAISEADLRAGRYDGAEVQMWLVNWQEPSQRQLRFCGTIGEVTQAGGSFRAELRGLSEGLTRPITRVIQPGCDAMLGDGRCGFDLASPGYRQEFVVVQVTDGHVLHLADGAGFENGWFQRGKCSFVSGAARGLTGMVKRDQLRAGLRVVELWSAPALAVQAGDRVELVAGCDKRAATCKAKFGNFANFRGFPDLPTEDWLTAFPAAKLHGAGA